MTFPFTRNRDARIAEVKAIKRKFIIALILMSHHLLKGRCGVFCEFLDFSVLHDFNNLGDYKIIVV